MDDSELDDALKQLALNAQSNPVGSGQRQRSLNQLLRLLQASGKLGRPFRHEFPHLYEEIYAEALQRLFIYICQKIDLYRPEHKVLQWVNFMLKTRFFYEARQDCVAHYRPERQRLSQQPWLDIDEVENYPYLGSIPQPPEPTLEEQARDYIETDPEGTLAQTHIRGRPDITLQALILRNLDGYKWHEIATAFEIALPTIHSFYRRQLPKLKPQFQQYLTS